MPYPREHAARVIEPSSCEKDSFRRKVITEGVSAILAKMSGSDKLVVQSYRFAKSKFSPEQAKRWLRRHNVSAIKFEPSVDDSSDDSLQTFEGNFESFVSIPVHNSARCVEKTLKGKKVLAVPTVMMTVGVRNGILYSEEELSKYPEAWNGRPVTCIDHPMDEVGTPVSANDPTLMEKMVVGSLFNCGYKNGGLRGEAWVDVEDCGRIHAPTLDKLRTNSGSDVSIGAYQDHEMVTGVYRGKEYYAIARNIRPDHLAILYGKRGSCSWEDGAGIPRVNSMSETNPLFDKDVEGLFLNAVERTDCSLCEVTDSSFVVQQEDVFVQYGYAVNGEQVKIVSGPLEVNRIVSYIPVSDKKEEEKKPTQGDQSMDKELVKKVIANSVLGFTEADTEHLMKLPVELLTKLTQPLQKPITPPEPPKTVQEVVANAPKHLQGVITHAFEVLDAHNKALKKEKDDLIQKLIANKEFPFTKEELDGKELSELHKLEKLVPKGEADFSGKKMGPTGNSDKNSDDDAPPPMPSMEWGKK